jgi:DNA-binding response OmpR family regulator
VDTARDTEQSVSMLRRREYQAAIVDFDLPSAEGVAILQFVRTSYQDLPIVILASCADLAERVQALDSGADDVVQKPFAFFELSARVRAVLRRSTRGSQSVLRLESLELDRVERTVTRAARIISLTPREFCLLEYLMLRQGCQMSRAQIVEHVWKLSSDTPTNVVDVYINYLRQESDGRRDCKLIHTIRRIRIAFFRHFLPPARTRGCTCDRRSSCMSSPGVLKLEPQLSFDVQTACTDQNEPNCSGASSQTE